MRGTSDLDAFWIEGVFPPPSTGADAERPREMGGSTLLDMLARLQLILRCPACWQAGRYKQREIDPDISGYRRYRSSSVFEAAEDREYCEG